MDNFEANLKMIRHLGSGVFGSVWLAEAPVLGTVAVKRIDRKPSMSSEDWAYLKNKVLAEGERLKDAEHDRVVKVFHVLKSQIDDEILLVMEYCPHGCIGDLYRRGPMQLSHIRSFMTDAALGLQSIHSRGMLHRDIKPDNILLDGFFHAKIADFGLVTDKLRDGYGPGGGYADHLAPEYWKDGYSSIRTDIWAFGITLYQLLHGYTFYKSLPPLYEETPKGGLALRLPWLAHIPDEWRRFVRKTLHDDSHERIQDSVELLKGLAKLPISPDWQCDYQSDATFWETIKGDRRIEVSWITHSPSKHEWAAFSYPLQSGAKRKIGGSKGFVSRTQANKELRSFFDNFHV